MSEIIHDAAPQGVLAGLLSRERLAAELGCSPRTVIRREREGMPFLKVGALRLYDPATVRTWLLAQEVRPAAPKRGRPAKRG